MKRGIAIIALALVVAAGFLCTAVSFRSSPAGRSVSSVNSREPEVANPVRGASARPDPAIARRAILERRSNGPQAISDRAARRGSGSHSHELQVFGNTIAVRGASGRITMSAEGLAIQSGKDILRSRFASMTVGGITIASGYGMTPVLRDGEAIYAYQHMTERYRLEVGGVEQFFDVARLPTGVSGEMVVSCQLESTTPWRPDLSDGASVWFGRKGMQTFYVKDAAVVDASGRRLDLPISYDGSTLRLVIPETWIASAAFPIMIDPLVGSVFDLDSVSQGNTWLSNNLDVAYNATDKEFFVTYIDWDVGGNDATLVGQRVSLSGGLIGSAVVIDAATVGFDTLEPAVAWASTTNRYCVAYRRSNNTFVRLLNNLGADIGTGELNIDDVGTSTFDSEPDVAFDGTNFMVVWHFQDTTNLADIRGRRYTTAGAPVAGSFAIETATTDSVRPSIAFLGGAANTYVVAYAEDASAVEFRNVMSRTVSTTQTVGAAQAVSTGANNNDWPRVAANLTSQEFLVVWEENDTLDEWAGSFGSTTSDIAFRRLNSTGTPQGAAEVALQNGVELDYAPGVAWSDVDNEYVIMWQRGAFGAGADVFGARVDGGADTILENGTSIAAGADDEYTPFLAAQTGSKKVLAAFGSWDNLNFLGKFSAVRFSTSAIVSTPPSVPSNLQQYMSNGTTQLLVGDSTNEQTVQLKGTVTDADAGEVVSIEVELRPVATAFTNAVTHAGSAVTTGNVSTATATGLAITTAFHWQARATDENGNSSAWVSFGGNTENPPTNPAATDFSTNGITLGAPATVFSENFDAGLPGTWTVAGTGGLVTWKADALATPVGPGPGGAFVSAPNSLNYNDDTDFDNAATNSGTATTPVINSSGNVTVSFQCNYQTEETGTTFDTRRLQLSTDNFATIFSNNQLAGTAAAPLTCSAMGTWHTHTIPINAVPGPFRLRFAFDTVDAVLNALDGWYVDDVSVVAAALLTDQSPNAPTALQQRDSLNAIIAVGGNVTGDGTTVRFEGTVSDPDAADTLRLQVEVKPINQAFDGSGVLTSAAVANGATVQISTTFGGGSQHWRARTLDNTGVPSAWVSFPLVGPNADLPLPAAVDFKINTPPLAPSLMGQFRSDTVTVIAQGGATDESTVVFKATVTDNDAGDTVRLHVEVQPTGSPFTGADATGSPSGFVASGSIATVTVTGLAAGAYKWQAWTEDNSGFLSGVSPTFTAFGLTDPDFTVIPNTAPGSPSSLGQFKLDAATGVPIGGSTSETGAVFKGTAVDPEGNSWRMQVELRLVTAGFTAPASPVIDNVIFFQSAFVSSGATASVTASGLANGNYHWAARAVDSAGNASAWVGFGGNTENPPTNPAATDFNVTAAVGNTPPASAAGLGQFKADTVTAIAQSGITNETIVVFKATATDPDGNPVALQVEVVPMAGAFTGTPTATGSFVPSGSIASVTVAALANNDYKWQARLIDSQGATSAAYVEFGSLATDFTVLTGVNLNPNTPTALAQFKLDAITGIATGGTTDELGIVLRGTVTDADATPNSVKLQVEVKPVNQPFVNSSSAESALVASGSTASVTFSGLVDITSYHWQARTVDSLGAVSAWVSFDVNAENPPTNPAGTDVAVNTSTNTTPLNPALLGQFRSNGTTAIAAGGSTNQTTVVFKANVDGGNGDQVKLQVELVPNAGAFSGTATAETAFMASGSQGTITLSGLAINLWKWRARAVDIGGKSSSWVDFPPGDPDFSVVANSAPTAPVINNQFRLDGITIIAVAGTTVQPSYIVKATATDIDLDQWRLQVDIGPSGVGLTGTIAATSTLTASGAEATVTVAIPAPGNWQWQVRAIDENGATGAFVEFQVGNGIDFTRLANATPTVSGPDQADNAGASVPLGGTIVFRGQFRATVNDADGDPVSFEVEIRPSLTVFTNTATHTGSGSAGSLISAIATGLADGSYHWQYRAIDINGNATAWTTFNAAAVHFVWVNDPGGSRNNLGCPLGAASRAQPESFLVLLLLAALAAGLRRRITS